MLASRTAPVHAERAVERFVDAYSIEIALADVGEFVARRDPSLPGREVFLSALPEHSLTATVEACAALLNAGYTPVPHLCARHHTRSSLDRYLDALASQAGVEAAVVVGGSIEHPAAGAYESAIQAIATGLFVKHGITRIGLAAYPDGHRFISATTLRASLTDKIRACQDVGIEPFVITQFSFDAQRVADWCASFVDTHPGVSLAVGLAGPARHATLMRYASRCGVPGAIRALATHRDTMSRPLAQMTPQAALTAMAPLVDEYPGVLHAHFYAFGGFAQTTAWAVARGSQRHVAASDRLAMI